MRVLVGVLLANAEVASGFLGRLNVHAHVIAASMNRNDQLRRSAAKDDSPTSTEESSEASDASFFESLRARTETLLDERSRVVYNWRTGSCESHVGAALAMNYVRRLALHWPLAAIGTNDGGVLVANVAAGKGAANRLVALAQPEGARWEGARPRSASANLAGGGDDANRPVPWWPLGSRVLLRP